MKEMKDGSGYVTTQGTGKGVKLSYLIGVAMVVTGVVMTSGADYDGVAGPLLMVGGLVTLVVAKIIGWWKYS